MSQFHCEQIVNRSEKIRQCCECLTNIETGESYIRTVAKVDTFYYDARHIDCHAAAKFIYKLAYLDQDWYGLYDIEGDFDVVLLEKYPTVANRLKIKR